MTIRNIIADQNIGTNTKYVIVAKACLDENFRVDKDVKCIIEELKPFNYHSLGNSLLKKEKEVSSTSKIFKPGKRIIKLNNKLFIDANLFIFHGHEIYSLSVKEGLLKLRAETENLEIKQLEP